MFRKIFSTFLLLFCFVPPVFAYVETQTVSVRAVVFEAVDADGNVFASYRRKPSTRKAYFSVPTGFFTERNFKIVFPDGVVAGDPITVVLQEKDNEPIRFVIGFEEAREENVGDFVIRASYCTIEQPPDKELW